MPDDLYHRDILDWAEREADFLRRLSRGEGVNASVDWPHVIEEVQDVGLSELRACESLLRQAMLHLLKLRAFPDAAPVRHWRGETVGFLGEAASRLTPAMRRRLDLDALWRRAVRQIAAEESAPIAAPVPCPFALDELLAEDADIATLVARIG